MLISEARHGSAWRVSGKIKRGMVRRVRWMPAARNGQPLCYRRHW